MERKHADIRVRVLVFGMEGKLLRACGVSGQCVSNVYFAGKLIRSRGQAVVTDRLGSVRWKQGVGALRYYPYGEEQVPASQTGTVEKFGTYQRDVNGLDYADQRYYAPGTGRFLTADPYQASGGPADPGSWNRYAYVLSDPVNFHDPSGRMIEMPAGDGDNPGGYGGGGFFSGLLAALFGIYPGGAGNPGGNNIEPKDPNPYFTATVRLQRAAAIAAAISAVAQTIVSRGDDPALTLWPTAIRYADSCSARDPVTGAYELHVTYEIISQLGTVMHGADLAGVSIYESFQGQTGNLGNLNSQAATWSYPRTISSAGTFEDILSSQDFVFTPMRGTALQQFTGAGSFGLQPLGVLGFGNISGVNFNTYGHDLTTVNGRSANHTCN